MYPRAYYPCLAKRSARCAMQQSAFKASPSLHVARAMSKSESVEEAAARRMRESKAVEERLVTIFSEDEFRQQLRLAGNKLVVLEINSDTLCQTGFDEAELQWKDDKERALQPCRDIKHVFQRTARESEEVVFIELQDVESDEGSAFCDALGIDVYPTLQFWKNGRKLWEHRGIMNAEHSMGEGVLYYGNSAANNEKASDYVTMIESRADLEKFITPNGPEDEKILNVLDVSLMSATPCVRIFPAVLALAKSFAGYVKFARMTADSKAELAQISRELKVVEAPCFVFFRNGKEVGRYVGSSRGDLIGQVLQQQSPWGLPPPPPRPSMRKGRGRS